MVALVIEFVIASAIAVGVWTSGHPIWAVIVWFGIMGCSNTAYESK
jgi:hypothetical protein